MHNADTIYLAKTKCSTYNIMIIKIVHTAVHYFSMNLDHVHDHYTGNIEEYRRQQHFDNLCVDHHDLANI